MEEEKITLDRETFKTLASDTRVNILKSLDTRRKTLSELSKQFGMSVSTISEHLNNLSKADLVVQKDEGHKWKYYELTRKGRGVLYPETKKIWVLLSISAIALLVLGVDALGDGVSQNFMAAKTLGEDMIRAPVMGEAGAAAAPAVAAMPWVHIAGLAIFAGLLFTSMFLLYRKRTPRLP